MTLLSLTDCCRLLAIDAKTLHRWLAQAQLPLEAHLTDARLKGVNQEHLLLLARIHHRRLAAWPEEPSAPAPSGQLQESPPLPPWLLELLQTLSQLPAQLTALQQQVAELCTLVQSPSASISAAQARAAARGKPKPASAARSRPAASAAPKSPRQSAHVIPLVEAVRDGRSVVICPQHGLLDFEPESPQWFAWLATRSSFRFVGQAGRFTAHREVERVPNGAWRAHRHIRNHSYNLRLGPTEALTIAVLEQAAATLQAHLT